MPTTTTTVTIKVTPEIARALRELTGKHTTSAAASAALRKWIKARMRVLNMQKIAPDLQLDYKALEEDEA